MQCRHVRQPEAKLELWLQTHFLPRLNGTDPRELKPRGFQNPAVTERRRPAIAAIVVSAVQPARIASPSAIPGDRETSTMLVIAKIAVATRPASAAKRDARSTVIITRAGAKNGTITRIENGPFVWFASHQVGFPTVYAEIAKAINEPVIKR